MNYYQHHIGDYAAATAHLTLIEDAIYSRLLRRYYLQEAPLPADVKHVARLAGARAQEEIEATHAVLDEFFFLTDEGWRNKRADEEIAAYHAKAETARDNGKRGGRPAKEPKKTEPVSTENPAETNRVFLAIPEETGSKANQEPITNNQESKKKAIAQASPTLADLLPDVREQIAKDFANIRKTKRAPLTETAVAGIRREANAAGLTLEQALTICCERGWQGFKADWLPKAEPTALPGGGRRKLA